MRFLGLTTVAIVLTLFVSAGAQQTKLIQSGDMRYEGAFRVPSGTAGGSSFDGGAPGRGLTYYPAHNTLLTVGNLNDQMVAEITIPTPSHASTVSGLPVATFRQNFKDILEGKRESVSSDPNGDRIGGMLVSGNNLIVSAFGFYDNTNTTLSHFSTNVDFSVTGEVKGPFVVGSAGGGYVGGYMATIPAEWQSALGGQALTGQCCLAINGRTSSGPAASVFNPTDVGSVSPVPAKQVLSYPLSNLPPASVFVNSDMVRGLAVPPGTRSALFIGRHGTGASCYGDGGPCGDPTDQYKGYHAYPYVYQVWAYDLQDFVAVKNGTKQPWELRPYAMWTLSLPFADNAAIIEGAAFDPAASRLYVAAANQDGARPVIHVFSVTGGSVGTVTTPTPPANFRIISGD